MKKNFSFVIFSIALLLLANTVSAQIVSLNLFLQGKYLEIGAQKTGALGTSVNAPSGYHPHDGTPPCGGSTPLASVSDYLHTGWSTGTPHYMGDYTLPGSPWEQWCIQMTTSSTALGIANSDACGYSGGLAGAWSSYSSGGGSAIGMWNGSMGSGALTLRQQYRVDTLGLALIVTCVMVNTTSSDITGVYYMRCCDPDNDETWTGGSFETRNVIPYQNDADHRVMVTALAYGSNSAADSSTGHSPAPYSIGTKDCRAEALVFSSWPLSCTNLAPVYARSASCDGSAYYTANSSTLGDIAIGLIYKIGTIPAGDSAIISYAYIYNADLSSSAGIDSAFPDPQMVISGVAYDSIDTVGCAASTGTSIPVNIINATDKCWSWSTWTWAPATGLSSTTGVSNNIDLTTLTGPITYTITGTDSAMGDCSQKVFLLTVIPPTITVSNNGPICAGDSLIITVTDTLAGSTYNWTGPGGFTATTQNIIIPGSTRADSGVYNVSVYFGGCDVTGTTSVIVNTLPSPTLANNGPLCPGDNLDIIQTGAGAGTTFGWSGPGGFTTNTQNVTIGGVTFADSGVYTVVDTTSTGCLITNTTTVVVHSTPPSPGITNPTYCQYASTVPLSATGSNILWYTSASGGTGATTAPTPSSTFAGTFTWYVTQTINGCQSARYPVVVTINPQPLPPTITDDPGYYCPNSAWATFTYATGTGSVLWYTGPTGGTGSSVVPIVNTAIPGIDSFWASQTLLGCEGPRSLITITVYDTVVAHFDTLTRWGCHGDTLIFNNTSFGATNYLWSFGDGTSSALADPTHVYLTQAIDTVKLFAHSLYCLDSLIKIFDLRHPVSSSFSLAPSIACQLSPVSFTNSSIATTPTYTWLFGDGTTSSSASPTHIYSNTGTYTITLVVADFVPCKDTSYGSVAVDTLSPISMSITDTAFCLGTYITLTGYYSSIGDTQLMWSFGNGDTVYNANPVSYAYTTAGTHTITATTKYRVCPDATISRTITAVTQPSINLGPDTSICPGSEVGVMLADGINAGNTAASWLWSTGETTSSILVTAPGVYYGTVDIGGCTATDTVTISSDCYVNLSNCFSPNGDGVNDYFNPREYFTKNLSQFSMSIYDRWGELIFQTNAVDGRGWDGTFNGVKQPQGVYIYLVSLTFTDGQKVTKQGNLTLLR